MQFKSIERQALSLLREYSQKTGWERRPPVPVSLIAEICFDMVVVYEKMGRGVSGELFLEERLIKINADDSPQRQNFTIGHELGHLVLHYSRENPRQLSLFEESPRELQICLRGDKKRLERDANVFSASLLMPRELIVKTYRKVLKETKKQPLGNSNEKAAIDYMSKKFGVSLEAMQYRLIDLKLKTNMSTLSPG